MINLVVAMPAEASPLISHYRLRLDHKAYGFSVYQRDVLSLITSGLGKVNAAVATMYLQACVAGNREEPGVWINVGVAGHAGLEIGQAVMAGSIRDQATNRVWQPGPVAETICPAGDILTLDKADFSYRHDEVVEMEASGFVATALRFCHRDRVQCFKVIADNAANSGRDFEPAQGSRLIAGNIARLDALIEAMTGGM
jgi:nucleoside phosphorylase